MQRKLVFNDGQLAEKNRIARVDSDGAREDDARARMLLALVENLALAVENAIVAGRQRRRASERRRRARKLMEAGKFVTEKRIRVRKARLELYGVLKRLDSRLVLLVKRKRIADDATRYGTCSRCSHELCGECAQLVRLLQLPERRAVRLHACKQAKDTRIK